MWNRSARPTAPRTTTRTATARRTPLFPAAHLRPLSQRSQQQRCAPKSHRHRRVETQANPPPRLLKPVHFDANQMVPTSKPHRFDAIRAVLVRVVLKGLDNSAFEEQGLDHAQLRPPDRQECVSNPGQDDQHQHEFPTEHPARTNLWTKCRPLILHCFSASLLRPTSTCGI